MAVKETKRDILNYVLEKYSNDEKLVAYATHEIELLDKKKSNGKAKVNEAMNTSLDLVYNALAEIGEKVTPTELIAKAGLVELANELGIVTSQKISAYLNKLVDMGRVEKVIEKKKSYFMIKDWLK